MMDLLMQLQTRETKRATSAELLCQITFRSTAYKMKINARTSSQQGRVCILTHLSGRCNVTYTILSVHNKYGRQSIHEVTQFWVKTGF